MVTGMLHSMFFSWKLNGKKLVTRLILDPLLIQAPKEAIDYVITHELCHMKYKNHDANFYQLLETKFPGWRRTKEKLELLI
jgi:predicted metal-dependent hydrolase